MQAVSIWVGAFLGGSSLHERRVEFKGGVAFMTFLAVVTVLAVLKIRDCETTIKIKCALLRGVGRWGREENCPQTLFFFFFVGNATTIKI